MLVCWPKYVSQADEPVDVAGRVAEALRAVLPGPRTWAAARPALSKVARHDAVGKKCSLHHVFPKTEIALIPAPALGPKAAKLSGLTAGDAGFLDEHWRAHE